MDILLALLLVAVIYFITKSLIWTAIFLVVVAIAVAVIRYLRRDRI